MLLLTFAALIIGNVALLLIPDTEDLDIFAIRMLVAVLGTATICILATLFTSTDQPDSQTIKFYKKLRIHGRGWLRVRELTGVEPIAADLKNNTIAWLANIALTYSVMLGIG